MGLETLLLKKLYCTLNSPDEYPKFCKSLTGSISIIGKKPFVFTNDVFGNLKSL